jgi:Rad3-related DNA helicase
VNNVRVGELLFISKRDREVDVEISLVDVGPRLADDLWGNVTAILTSATIPDTLPKSLGLAGTPIEHFDSPFDYAANSLLYVPDNFPSRNDAGAEGRSSRSSSNSSPRPAVGLWLSSPIAR